MGRKIGEKAGQVATKMNYKIKSSKIVFKRKWLSIRSDTITSNKKTFKYYSVIIPEKEFPIIVAITPNNKIIMERIFRFPLRRYVLELPKGTVEKNETILQSAKRELLEETGYEAERTIKIGKFIANPSRLTETATIFVALNARKKTEQRLEELEDIRVIEMTYDEILEKASKGLVDGVSIAALTLAMNLIKKLRKHKIKR